MTVGNVRVMILVSLSCRGRQKTPPKWWCANYGQRSVLVSKEPGR